MKKTKLAIGIFVGLIVIVLTIVLLACTVFVVRKVTVIKNVSSNYLDTDIIVSSSGLKKGASIVTIDKDKIKAEIEKTNPYVEVLEISRDFPNEVIIKVTVRSSLMMVLSEDGANAAILDADMKVLDVVPYSSSDKSQITKVDSLTFSVPEDIEPRSLVGGHLTFSDPAYENCLKDLAAATKEEALNLPGNAFRKLFTRIDFRKTGSGTRVFMKTETGVSFVLDTSMESSFYQQLFLCITLYTMKDTNVDRTKGYILYEKRGSQASYNWVESLD